MTRPTQLVIFDWDGTLADSLAGIVQNIEQAAQRVGLAPLLPEQIRDVIGLGWQEALRRLYPAIEPEQVEQMRLDYLRRQALQPPLVFYPGILTLLEQLQQRGCLMAIATGKGRQGLDESLAVSGLSPLMCATRTADQTASKPDPLMLTEILAETGLEPAQAVMVGDTHYDLAMAERIGMPSIGVSYGVHPPSVLARHRPVAIVDDAAGLQAALLARIDPA